MFLIELNNDIAYDAEERVRDRENTTNREFLEWKGVVIPYWMAGHCIMSNHKFIHSLQ